MVEVQKQALENAKKVDDENRRTIEKLKSERDKLSTKVDKQLDNKEAIQTLISK